MVPNVITGVDTRINQRYGRKVLTHYEAVGYYTGPPGCGRVLRVG